MKIDRTVKRETLYIAAFVLILSALMEAIFLIAGKWDYTVLLGNLLSGAAATANFFFLGVTVQKALTKEPKKAEEMMNFSKRLRLFLQFAVALVGVLLSCFNTVAVLIPFFFPRIAILFRPFIGKNQDEVAAGETAENDPEDGAEEEDPEDE